MPIHRLAPTDYQNTPWKNGGGMSATIAGERIPGAPPDDWSGVIWQLGRTRIVVAAPFSDLSGFERLQVVIGGRGLVLKTPDGEIDLRNPFQPRRYDGGMPIVSELENGPVEVINLIARRDLCAIDLAVLEGGAETRFSQGLHVIHAPGVSALLRLVFSRTERVRAGTEVQEFELLADQSLTFESKATVQVVTGRTVIATVRKR